VDPATGRAIGATEMAPEVVKRALDDGEKIVIIDTRSREAFEQESLPGAINVPLAELDGRLADFPKDTRLVFT
jgi:rhodanese-related sulfurtransferase